MRAPPELRGGAPVRFASLVFGLVLCALGVVSFLESELGLPPWDVLHQGIADVTRLSFGEANLAVSVVILALSWMLGARVGIGTVTNAALVGSVVIVLLSFDWVTDLSESSLPARIALMAAALAFFGSGTAFYIGAAMGAGPRDSLMLVVSSRLHVRIGFARTITELSALLAGFALGGTVGAGTAVFAFGIGPAVELAFSVIDRTPLTK